MKNGLKPGERLRTSEEDDAMTQPAVQATAKQGTVFRVKERAGFLWTPAVYLREKKKHPPSKDFIWVKHKGVDVCGVEMPDWVPGAFELDIVSYSGVEKNTSAGSTQELLFLIHPM